MGQSIDTVRDVLVFVFNNFAGLMFGLVLLFGVFEKIKKFLGKTTEEQKKILCSQSSEVTELIQKGILELVIAAEVKYGEKTGQIKKSSVYNMLIEKYPDLVEYIKHGVVTKEFVDECIELGVDKMNQMINSNDAVKQILNKKD